MAPELLASWWAWIATVTLQASALLLFAWLVDVALRRRAWPQLLATLWRLALLRLVLPAQWSSPWSVTAPLGEAVRAAVPMAPSAALIQLLFGVWALVASVLLGVRALSRARLRRGIEFVTAPSAAWWAAIEKARNAAGARTQVRIGVLDALRTPAVFGALRPTLLLPPHDLERDPTPQDEHALLHELHHVRRHDLLADEVVALLRALFWFHPLVWSAAVRLHELSELACDHDVAQSLGERSRAYRDTLVRAARELLTRRAPADVRPFLGARSLLLRRIERLEAPSSGSPGRVRTVSALVAGLAAACVLPMAPTAPSLRRQALDVFAAEQRGESQSCFTLQAAALVLAADSSASEPVTPPTR